MNGNARAGDLAEVAVPVWLAFGMMTGWSLSPENLRERVRAGLDNTRQNGKRLGRPATAALHTAQVRKLHRAGVREAEIARRLQIGRTSVRRILAK